MAMFDNLFKVYEFILVVDKLFELVYDLKIISFFY